MTTDPCPDEDVLIALVDEPDETSDVARHVARCTACMTKKEELVALFEDLRAPVREYRAEALVSRVSREIVRSTSSREPTKGRSARVLVVAALVTTLAVAAVMELTTSSGRSEGAFASRGEDAAPSARRDVDLEFAVIARAASGTTVAPVTDGTVLRSTEPLLLSYATRTARLSYGFLCILVDARSEIHWLYPAFEDAMSDPSSIVLAPGQPSTPMDTAVTLEDVPSGPGRISCVVGSAPLRVSDVERLAPKERDPRGLSSSFPGADIRSWSVLVEARSEGGAQ